MSGRSDAYSATGAEHILAELLVGRMLRDICRDAGMPAEKKVRRWILEDREGFAARYQRAREAGLTAIADELLEIADDSRNDWIERGKEGRNGEPAFDRENLARSKLRIEVRQWLLAKGLPNVHGSREDAGTENDAENQLAELMRIIDSRGRGLPSEDDPPE